MKTAVSVPDDLFAEAEQLARRSHSSRSEMYSAALREYLARHAPDDVTEALDQVIDEVGDDASERGFREVAARRVLATIEW